MENWKCSISAVYKSCVTVRSIDSIENKITQLLEYVLRGLSNSFGRNRWKTKFSDSENQFLTVFNFSRGPLPRDFKTTQRDNQEELRDELQLKINLDNSYEPLHHEYNREITLSQRYLEDKLCFTQICGTFCLTIIYNISTSEQRWCQKTEDFQKKCKIKIEHPNYFFFFVGCELFFLDSS